MAKRFIIGDIHGHYEALIQCLERSGFNYEHDLLIVLGDVVDGGLDTYKVVEELLKITNLIYIIGNHDKWFIDFFTEGKAIGGWLHQGGINTINSYLIAQDKDAIVMKDNPTWENYMIEYQDYMKELKEITIPVSHQEFFNNYLTYFIIDGDKIAVHGGFNHYTNLEDTQPYTFMWDRSIIDYARTGKIKRNDGNQNKTDRRYWNKVFIGHTTTQHINGTTEPAKFNNLICLDCGGGWNGKLCIMDLDTEEYWLSDTQEALR